MNYSHLQREIQEYIRSFFSGHQSSCHLYHNIRHTEHVVAATRQIAYHYSLNEKDLFIVETAAWFHDTGYCLGEVAVHEKSGAGLAATFLNNRNVDKEIVQAVTDCILATKMPQCPENRLEEILCDADLFHLGTDDFYDWNELLHKEIEASRGITISKSKWRQITICLLQQHHYHTGYCRRLLNAGKDAHLQNFIHIQKSMKESGSEPDSRDCPETGSPNRKEKKPTKTPNK